MKISSLASQSSRILFETCQQRTPNRAPSVIGLDMDRGKGRSLGRLLPKHVANFLIADCGNDCMRQATHPLFEVAMHRRLPRMNVLWLVVYDVGAFELVN